MTSGCHTGQCSISLSEIRELGVVAVILNLPSIAQANLLLPSSLWENLPSSRLVTGGFQQGRERNGGGGGSITQGLYGSKPKKGQHSLVPPSVRASALEKPPWKGSYSVPFTEHLVWPVNQYLR